MQFGVMLPVSGAFASAAAIVRVAQEAEALGYDAVSIHDHINWDQRDKYHFIAGTAEAVDEAQRQGRRVDHFYEGIVTLSHVAGATRRVRLITGAAVLPWRNPVVFAKQLATLQELSQGRVVAGVCIGNVRGDFEALGVTFERRGALMDEYLQLLRLILSPEEEVFFQGHTIQVPHGVFFPKPGRLPILYAGESDQALERVARYCDGWLPLGPPDFFRERLPVLERLLRARGRDLREVTLGFLTKVCIDERGEGAREKASYTMEKQVGLEEIQRHPTLAGAYLVGAPQALVERFWEYAEVGVSLALLSFLSPDLDQMVQDMRLFAREVMPRLS